MARISSLIDGLTDIAESVGVAGPERTRDISATHRPESATTLAVSTKNGRIDLTPADGDDLRVDATVKTRREDDDLDAASLDVSEDGDVVSVSITFPDTTHGMSAALDVSVPDSLMVGTVETKNGKITLQDVRGDAHVETKNGAIDVEHVDGAVTAYAKNGAIAVRDTPVRNVASKNGALDLRLADVTDDVSAETKNGVLEIRVPADTDATFALDTTRGKASVEGLTCLVEDSSRTHVTGELGTGGPHIDARTKNGRITLEPR